MKEIPLTQGMVALVDDEDFERLSACKWFVGGLPHRRYAMSRKNSRCVYMHREILGVTSRQVDVDHVNGDRLDCRRSNLRACTRSQNMGNAKRPKNGSSQYKGVSYFRRDGCWMAKITVGRAQTFLGYFDKEEDAGRAYDAAAREVYGEFARVNFPTGEERAA